MPYIMLPSGKHVRVDEHGRPVKKNPGTIPTIPVPADLVAVQKWRACQHKNIDWNSDRCIDCDTTRFEIKAGQRRECGKCGLHLLSWSIPITSKQWTDGAGLYLCEACMPKEEPPPPPVAPRRFCGCGQEAWPRNGSVPLDYDGSPICNDCSADRARVLLGEPVPKPLSERIRDAQPEVEEHAFERPGYSWP